MVSNYIIAKFQISEDVSLMAMIDNDTIHFFDRSGNDVQRDILTLPDVFVINFIDGENRAFYLVEEKECITQGCLYVINKENKVIFTSAIEDAYNVYTRITNNSIIIGVSEIETESDILIPSSSSGKLIDNNQLTNKKLIGIRHNYYLLSEESEDSDEYYLYALRPKFYDTDEPDFVFVQKFHADFLILWKSNIVYYNNNSGNSVNVKAYGAEGYYWETPNEQSFNVDIDLKSVNWKNDVQILYDNDSIILHHIKASTDYKGFTIVIEQVEYGKFRLCNQKKIGKYYNETIELYANSLILLNNPSGFFIHNRNGNVIAKAEKDYDYQKQRVSITDYAIIDRRLSEPWIKSPIQNNYTRYGIISTETLEIVVPTNFNKIDFIVLEAPSTKHYRTKGEYEIYIKVCLETIDKYKKSIENWGLFKHSECIIPCFYRSIDVIRLKSNFIFILEQQDGLKGIFYKDKTITQCIYERITELGCYLLMNRTDGMIDILYIDKESIKLYEHISSVTPSSVQLNFLKDRYINNESLIVFQNDKYGLICKGQFVAECIYDKIELINVNPNYDDCFNQYAYNPLWFILQKDNKNGLFGTHGIMTDIIYDEVDVIDWRTYHPKRNYSVVPIREFVLELDGKYYTAKEKNPICDNSEQIFRGFISPDELVFSHEDETCLEFYTYRGEKRDIAVFDSDGDSVDMDDYNDIESMYSDCEYALPIPAVWRIKKIQVNISEYKYIFSFPKNRIINNPFYKDIDDEDEEDDGDSYYHDYDYPDKTDYERDTYYALGGDDYDEWRNNGGNLDDMMDGMGY